MEKRIQVLFLSCVLVSALSGCGEPEELNINQAGSHFHSNAHYHGNLLHAHPNTGAHVHERILHKNHKGYDNREISPASQGKPRHPAGWGPYRMEADRANLKTRASDTHSHGGHVHSHPHDGPHNHDYSNEITVP